MDTSESTSMKHEQKLKDFSVTTELSLFFTLLAIVYTEKAKIAVTIE